MDEEALEKKFLMTNIVLYFIDECKSLETTSEEKKKLRGIITKIKNIFDVSDINTESTIKINLMNKIYSTPEELKQAKVLRAIYFFKKGQVEIEKKDLYRAIKYFDRAIENNAEVADYWRARALAHNEFNDADRAFYDSCTLVELDANCHEAFNILGHGFTKRLDWERAYRAFARAATLVPDNAQYASDLEAAAFRYKLSLETSTASVMRRVELERRRMRESKEVLRTAKYHKSEGASGTEKDQKSEDASGSEKDQNYSEEDLKQLSMTTMVGELPTITESIEALFHKSTGPDVSTPAEPAVVSEPVLPESVVPELVLPEPVLPEPVLPEPVLLQLVLPEAVSDTSSTSTIYEDAISEGLIAGSILRIQSASVITSDVATSTEIEGPVPALVNATTGADSVTTIDIGVATEQPSMETITVGTIKEKLEVLYVDAVTEMEPIILKNAETNTERVEVTSAATETISVLKATVGTNTEEKTYTNATTQTIPDATSMVSTNTRTVGINTEDHQKTYADATMETIPVRVSDASTYADTTTTEAATETVRVFNTDTGTDPDNTLGTRDAATFTTSGEETGDEGDVNVAPLPETDDDDDDLFLDTVDALDE